VAVLLGAFGAQGVRHFLDSRNPVVWQSFSRQRISELTSQGRIVLVRFKADWNVGPFSEMREFQDPGVRAAIYRNRVVPLLADWTEPSEEIEKELASLGARSIPVVAVYTPQSRWPPIVLRDEIVPSEVVQAIHQASD
jgi:thiol:disulfide interchange protein